MSQLQSRVECRISSVGYLTKAETDVANFILRRAIPMHLPRCPLRGRGRDKKMLTAFRLFPDHASHRGGAYDCQIQMHNVGLEALSCVYVEVVCGCGRSRRESLVASSVAKARACGLPPKADRLTSPDGSSARDRRHLIAVISAQRHPTHCPPHHCHNRLRVSGTVSAPKPAPPRTHERCRPEEEHNR